MRLFDPSLEVFFDAFGNLIRGGGHGGHPDLSEVAPEDGGVLTSVTYYEFEGFEPTGEAEFKGRYTYDSYDYDVNAGLYEVNARCYDPTPGRWLDSDPMGFDAGDTNLYRYVNNPPAIAGSTDSSSAGHE